MKNLFEAATVEEVKGRIAQLKADNERVWGKMNPAQALAHCSAAMEMAMGAKKPPRIFIGRLPGALCEEVDDRERKAHAAECGDGRELGGE